LPLGGIPRRGDPAVAGPALNSNQRLEVKPLHLGDLFRFI
jgi:hypothetical protein